MCIAASSVYTAELPVSRPNAVYAENFNCFRGTFDSLPEGFFVSLDGNTILTDSNEFLGVHQGGVTAGGCYAWKLGDDDYSLGYQPTSDEFTPGYFMVVVSNATGRTVSEVSISFDVVCLNNADRSSLLVLEMGTENSDFEGVPGMVFTSPMMQDKPAAWVRYGFSCRLRLGRPLKAGQCMRLRWRGDDAGGSSSRDEYGIDNLNVTLHYLAGTVITIQ